MNITLEQTCYGCPEQYEARDDDGAMVGFLHLRNGFFSVEARRPGEEMVTVYSARPHGDGVFDVDERQRYVDAAMAAIRTHVEPAPADARWEALKEYLRDRIDAETPVMEGFRGEVTGAASGGMVSAMRSTLAEMKKLEAGR